MQGSKNGPVFCTLLPLKDAALVVLAVLFADFIKENFTWWTGFDLPNLFCIFADGNVDGEGPHAGNVVKSGGSPLFGLKVELFDFFLRGDIGGEIVEDEVMVGEFAFGEAAVDSREGFMLFGIFGEGAVDEAL